MAIPFKKARNGPSPRVAKRSVAVASAGRGPSADPIPPSPLVIFGTGVIPLTRRNSFTLLWEQAPFNFKIDFIGGMTITVNDGAALIQGQAIGGSNVVEAEVVATLAFPAANPLLPRRDLVVLKAVADTFGSAIYKSSLGQLDFEIIPGVPAVFPVPPHTDAQLTALGKVRLGIVEVPAAAVSVGPVNIVDGAFFLSLAPPLPPPPPTPGGPQTETVTAGANFLAYGDAVYMQPSGTVDLADAAALATGRVFGVVSEVGGIPAFGAGLVTTNGVIVGAFVGFTPGVDVFLSIGGVSGATLTQTPPSAPAGTVVERLGKVTDNGQDLVVEIEPPVVN